MSLRRIILFILIICSALSAETARHRKRVEDRNAWHVQRLAVHGAKLVRATVLRSQLSLKPFLFRHPVFSRMRLSMDTASLATYYHDRGYFRSAVSIGKMDFDSSRKSVSIIINVNEGTPTTVYAIRTSGFSIDSLHDPALFGKLYAGSPCDASLIATARENILNHFLAKGYLEATIETKIVFHTDSSQADVVYVLKRGSVIRVKSIMVKGNVKTKPNVAARECTFEPGDTLTQDHVKNTVDQLYKTGLFEYVTVSIHPPEIDSLPAEPRQIDVIVQEKKFFAAEIGIGVNNSDSVKIDKLMIAPRVSGQISYGNMFGIGIKPSLSSGASLSEQEVRLGIYVPRIFGLHINANGEVAGIHEITTRYKKYAITSTEAIGIIPFRKGSISLAHSTEIDPQLDTLSSDTSHGFVSSSRPLTHELSTGLTIDTRDDYFSPKRGVFGNIDFAVSGLNSSRKDEFVRLESGLRLYNSFGTNFVFCTAARIGVMNPLRTESSIPQDKLFTLGGPTTLRCYPQGKAGPTLGIYDTASKRDTYTDKVSGGNAYLVFNVAEIRYPIYKAMTGAVFADAGNLWNHSQAGINHAFSLLDLREMTWCVGLGLRLKLPFGKVRFDAGMLVRQGEQNNPAYEKGYASTKGFALQIAMGEAF